MDSAKGRKSVIDLGSKIQFPAYGTDSLSSQVIFISGKRGSGKSWTAGVMLEEMNDADLQFVVFDVLGAHNGLEQLSNVSKLTPTDSQTIDMNGVVSKLSNGSESLLVDMTQCGLPKQQLIIADYCEALIEAKIGQEKGKTIMSVFEECQDFVPQNGKPVSDGAVTRLCKLGRGLGYGVTLISQRPASVSKESISQAAIYLTHNVINHRDLKALDEQLSFGTDREKIKRILSGIAAAQQGECVAYAPEYFRDTGYIRIGKIKGKRKVVHTGNSIDARSTSETAVNDMSGEAGTPFGSSLHAEGQNTLSDVGTLTAASTMLPNSPVAAPTPTYDPYNFDAETIEQPPPPVQWVPPIDYLAEDDMQGLEAENQMDGLLNNPAVALAGTLLIAGGTVFIIKSFIK